MAELLFKKGLWKNLPTTKTEGTVYVTTDEKSMYVDIDNNTRIRIQGTVHTYDNLTSFGEGVTPPYSTDVIYFIASENALVRYDGSKWIQLNATADSVKEAVKTLTDAVNENIENISANATAITNINNVIGKAAEGETPATGLFKDIADNKAAIESNDADILALQTAVGGANSGLVKDVNTLKATVGDANSGLVKDVAKNATDIVALQTADTNMGTRVDGIADRVTAVEGTLNGDDGLVAKVNKNTTDIGTLDSNKADKTALEAEAETRAADDAALGVRIDNLTTTVNGKASQTEVTTLTGIVNGHTQTLAGHTSTLEAIPSTYATIANLNTTNGVVAGHTTSISALQTKDIELGNSINSINGQITDINSKNATQDTAIEANTAAIKDINETKLPAKVDKSTYNEKVQSIETSISTLTTNTTNALNEKVDKTTYESAIEALNKEDDRLEGLIGTNAQDIKDLGTNKVDVSTYTTDKQALESSIGTNTANITDLSNNKVDKATYAEDKAKVEKAIGDNTEAIEKNAEAIDELKAALGLEDEGDTTLTARIEALEAEDVEINKTLVSHGTQITNLGTTKADQSTVEGINSRLTTAEGKITTAEGKITALEQESATHAKQSDLTALQTTVNTNKTDVDNFKTTVANTYATKTELTGIESTLNTTINDRINAVNAMTYKGGIGSASELSALTGVKIGDTYVVTAVFGDYQPGDLLVAKGTEVNDVIDVDTLTWDHVPTGYASAHEATMSMDENGKVSLTSYTGAALGDFTIKAGTGVSVVADKTAKTITISTVWGSF